jgi:GNAT superfamily N-acetyltransferase
VVRRVDERSLDAVCELWVQQRDERAPTEQGLRRVTPEVVRTALTRPETIAFSASLDGIIVGYVILSDCSLNPFSDSACVSVDQLYVAKDARRKGVARALMTAVATFADRHGADQIACNVPSSVRDSNRFFARLGFTPHTVRRVTLTAALQRRLVGDTPESRFALDQVLARRRVARIRAAQGRLAAH